jgi:hypothetical protein
MKKFLLAFGIISMAWASCQDLFAQKWTAGLRTGLIQDNLQLNDQLAQAQTLCGTTRLFSITNLAGDGKRN